MAYVGFSSASGSPNTDAQSLHTFLASCTDNIAGACSAVEDFLKEQPPEAAVGFFRSCFPLLLQKVFGFQDSVSSSSSSAWLIKATDEQSTRALRMLLHPSGNLFVALLALDREKAVQFIFPNERLPARVRSLLLLDRGVSLLSETSELFKNRMKVSKVGGLQLQLDLFEFYIFWFAYYAASFEVYGASQSSSAGKHDRPSPGRSLSHWVSNLHHTSCHQNTKASASRHGLYLQLLDLYLTQFVQLHNFTGIVHIPGTPCLSQGGFLLLTLLEFWVMKDDPWPLQASQLGAISTGFTHSGVEIEAVRVVVSYRNRLLKGSLETYTRTYEGGALLAASRGSGIFSLFGSPPYLFSTRQMHAVGDYIPNDQLLQRPLYRFISRAFVYWPAGVSVKQAWHLVELWIDYMQPWLTELIGKPGKNVHDTSMHSGRVYSALWQGYVIRNYPFYTTMVVHFLNFALKFVCSDLESILEMASKILGALACSKELLELLRKIDVSAKRAAGKMGIEQELIAIMDWEEKAPLSESSLTQASLPFLPQADVQQSRLFAPGEGGAFHTFQILILQCEAEIQFVPPESQKALFKSLDYVKHVGLKIFHPHLLSNLTPSAQAETHSKALLQDEMRALGRHTCFEVKYRGDWMRRPIESTEVAFLVRLLVRLSDIINDRLSLVGQAELSQPRTSCGKQSVDREGFPKFEELNIAELLRTSKQSVINLSLLELVKEIKAILLSCWLALCGQLRQHGWRVNLRFLAQKPVVVLLVIIFSWMLRKL